MNNTNDNTQNTKDNSPLIEGTNTKDSTQETIIDNSQDNIIKPIDSKYNIQNLKPFNPKHSNALTSEEAQRRGRLGGLKSGEVRRQRKTMRESIIELLNQPLTDDLIKQFGLEDMAQKEGVTCQDGILYAALREAFNGDIKAAQYLRDTAGEAPTLKTENRTEVITQDDLKTISNLKNYLTG